MIDAWASYEDCPACGARPGAPCISLYTHRELTAGRSLLSTPHGGRPAVAVAVSVAPPAAELEQPPAPGPVWSNGIAEAEHAAEFTEAMHTSARSILERLRAELGDRWQLGMLAYVTQGVSTEGLSPFQLAMLAVIDEEWTDAR